MKLSAWAKANGLAYQTAWRMRRNGKLRVAAEQLPTGTVIVHPARPYGRRAASNRAAKALAAVQPTP